MRLVTRSDFDGLACGALLKEIGLIDSWKFAHPKDLQDGLVEITENDVLIDDIICIAFIDNLCFYLNIYICALEKFFRQRYFIGFPPFVSRKNHIKFRLWHSYFPAFVIILAGTLKIFVIALRQIQQNSC